LINAVHRFGDIMTFHAVVLAPQMIVQGGVACLPVVSLFGTTEVQVSEAQRRVRGRRPAVGEPVLDWAFRVLDCFDPDSRAMTAATAARSTPARRSRWAWDCSRWYPGWPID
jgi:hypothetical protein